MIPLALCVTFARHVRVYPLDSVEGLKVDYGITAESVVYRGRKAVKLTEELDPENGALAVIPGLDFGDGTIEVDVAAQLSDNAGAGSRGFVGIAFRGSDDMEKYENFYLRMTNGRSPDLTLRPHAVQYCSIPGFTWDYLRKKTPGKYEAYTDLELGAWKHIKISVHGGEAQYYVGDMGRPVLVVHGLLGKQTHGKVALWVHAHTKAYYSNLKFSPG